MKYIGQNVYDLVSRFRADVIIERSDLEIRKISGQPTLELSAWSTTATATHAGRIKFLKSGTAAFNTFSAGNHTTSGEILGRIEAYGVDDNDGETLAAYIEFANDAVSDADSTPGKIVFATSDANDAGAPTVRLTIDDDGKSTFVGVVSALYGIDYAATDGETSRSITGIQTSAESFSNSDSFLMSAAAIEDKILSYGYSTGDITGVTAGTNLTGGGSSGAVTINLADASTSAKGAASFSSNNFSVSSGAVSLNTTQTLDTLTFSSVNTTDPVISLANLTDDQRGATLKFEKFRGLDPTSDAQDDDVVGNIVFASVDDGTPSAQDYGKIECVIADATHTQEAGNLNFYVPSYDGTLTQGLQLLGDTNEDGEVDVNIARGAASITTISGTLTMGSTATINNSGVLQVANQSNITGVGTISSGTWQGTSIATTYTAAKVTSIVAGDGIDISGATGDVTVTAETATDSNPGVVELATTGEADTGTDTARAVTPAGLKSHVDARFSYQYISFTGNATVPSDGDWMTLTANGISNHTWTTDLGSGGTTVGSSTVTIPTSILQQGIIVPYDCTLVGYASLIRSVGNHQSKVGLAVGVPTYNDFATFDCTLRAYNAADISAGPDTNYSQRPVRADYLNANHSMSAGHVIYPLIGSVASNSRVVQWNCTLVLKTLIP
jgi:hypothetical protein